VTPVDAAREIVAALPAAVEAFVVQQTSRA